MISFIFAILFAFLNRARGTRLFNKTTSTVVGRIASMGAMSLAISLKHTHDLMNFVISFACSFAGLMLWASPAWDKYWSAAIGDTPDMTKPAFAPVDYLMRIIFITPAAGIELRIWGLIALTLRMQLILLPLIADVFFNPAGFPIILLSMLLAFPYFILGLAKAENVVGKAEYIVGAIIGLMFGAI